jgi:hypothetical protein
LIAEAEPFLETVAVARELIEVFFAAAFRAERNVVPAVTRQPELSVALSTALHQWPPYPASWEARASMIRAAGSTTGAAISPIEKDAI